MNSLFSAKKFFVKQFDRILKIGEFSLFPLPRLTFEHLAKCNTYFLSSQIVKHEGLQFWDYFVAMCGER